MPTLNQHAVLWHGEEEEGARRKQAICFIFFQNHWLFFTERLQFHCLNFILTSNLSPGSCVYSKLARCAMAQRRRRRSTGKKGREGLFFNHHQLGLATKEVTRLAATARRRTTHVARRRMPRRARRRGEARRSAQTVVRCGILGGSFPSRDSQQQNSLLCTILLSFMVPPPFSIYQLLTLCASALYQSMSLVAVHNTRFMKLAGEIQT